MIVLFYRYFHQDTSCGLVLFTNSLWETNDFSTYLWIYPRTLFIHNSFPELKQDKFIKFCKIAQQGWIEINENEAKLTPAGADVVRTSNRTYWFAF